MGPANERAHCFPRPKILAKITGCTAIRYVIAPPYSRTGSCGGLAPPYRHAGEYSLFVDSPTQTCYLTGRMRSGERGMQVWMYLCRSIRLA